MIGNNFHRNRRKKVKHTASTGIVHVSRKRSSPEMSPKKPYLDRKKPTFAENDIPETGLCQSENYDTVVRQTVNFYSPQLIRIKATDREGNSIEVTY
ncbi:hypothetical protein ACSAZL_09485 [Methanosarcina sp. T3]|uniref:hypothetical protein n=1 Tax=Methanosarcina sp. T3 TaxID=3439062 RepID=UPI003F841A3A